MPRLSSLLTGISWNNGAGEMSGLRLDALRSKFQERTAELFSKRFSGQKARLANGAPGYDLYCPRSAAAQLGISVSFFRESVRQHPEAPVIVGGGVLACNTPSVAEVVGR